MDKIMVKAAPGTRCPMERQPRKYITDRKAVEVPLTVFYRSLLRDGSLIRVEPQEAKAVAVSPEAKAPPPPRRTKKEGGLEQ
jgi:hypothetical protein